jgi:hypothetical protein
LVKVLDESGGLIQFITGLGWINTINNFDPGEGYHINVNTNCTLTLNDPGKGTTPVITPESPANVYFETLTGNPFFPMNVFIRNIESDGFIVEEGDEIAVYDGMIEVGNMVIEQLSKDYQLMTLRSDDPITYTQDGFIAGGELGFRYWDKSENILYADIRVDHLFGDKNFTKLGTYGADLKISSLGLNENGLPLESYLRQNYPNPYTNLTNIEYGIAENAQVVLNIYDVYGRKVRTVEDARREPGQYKLTVEGDLFGAGIYYYRLEVTGTNTSYIDTRKMILY